jgi:hypothetical protein
MKSLTGVAFIGLAIFGTQHSAGQIGTLETIAHQRSAVLCSWYRE